MLHATNCNKAVTKLKQSCNTLVRALLQFVHACMWMNANELMIDILWLQENLNTVHNIRYVRYT